MLAVKLGQGMTFQVTDQISLYFTSSSATSHPKSVKLMVIYWGTNHHFSFHFFFKNSSHDFSNAGFEFLVGLRHID